MSAADRRYQLIVKPQDWQAEASDQLTLLESAGLDGIVLPSSCRNGTCRTCMCLMQSGRVSYRIEWPGLSVDEKREGYVLPCVAYPETDIVLQVPGATRAGKPAN